MYVEGGDYAKSAYNIIGNIREDRKASTNDRTDRQRSS